MRVLRGHAELSPRPGLRRDLLSDRDASRAGLGPVAAGGRGAARGVPGGAEGAALRDRGGGGAAGSPASGDAAAGRGRGFLDPDRACEGRVRAGRAGGGAGVRRAARQGRARGVAAAVLGACDPG